MRNLYRVENRLYDADALSTAIAGDGQFEQHRRRIEPWLSAIFQSEHLNLLVGSGFSLGLAHCAKAQVASMATSSISPELDEAIIRSAGRAAKAMGRGAANIEDQFSVALSLLAGFAVTDDPRAPALRQGLRAALANFANSVLAMEASISIASLGDAAEEAKLNRLLMDFLLSFASRTASRDRLHIFTTNYDRIIEHGLDLIGARPIDRFVGALSPRFRASRFDVDLHYTPHGNRVDARPLEGVVRMSKLHGSVDWRFVDGQIVRQAMPFGAASQIPLALAESLIIFPNAAKDIETAFYPYSELFRDFSAAICRPNSALISYGYGFGDDHVNRVIRDMLTLPSTHLVIISYDEAGGRITRFLQSIGRPAQVSYMIGSAIAALEPLVDFFLPKPAIDTITQRQAALLEARGRTAERSAGATEVS